MVFLRNSRSGGSLELPGNGHALGRRFARDDELERRMRPRLAVDPETVLGGKPAASAAEMPDRALKPEQSSLAIGGRGHFGGRGEMEANRERGGVGPAPAAGREQGGFFGPLGAGSRKGGGGPAGPARAA